MIKTVHQACVFLLIYFAGQTVCTCRGPYINLCSYSEDEFNSTDTENNSQDTCDCEEVTLCYVIKLSQNCSTVLIKLDANSTNLSQLSCSLTSLDPEEVTSQFEILNTTADELTLKLFTSEYGRFKFICKSNGSNTLNPTEGFNSSDSGELEIVTVTPSEVLVDTEVKLQLTVRKQITTNGTWCFVNTPDDSMEILLATWISDTKIECIGFTPKTPNFFTVSLGSQITQSIFDKGITIRVTSKPPVAQDAEYSSDFQKIFIHFDKNIELHSSCVNMFSEDIKQHFGEGFECFVKGNLLVVKMGLKFQNVDDLVIDPGNDICQAGCQSRECCMPALPANLAVLKPKLPGPSLSLYMKSACSGNEEQKFEVKVTPYKTSENYANQNQSQIKTGGKTQRKNLMMWRKMREFQGNIPREVALEVTSTDVLEDVETLGSLFNADENISGTAAKVTVSVQSSATTSTIVAEAEVTFCEVKLFRYKWLVNGEDAFEDGKLLVLKGLTQGKYLIKCLVIAVNSTEILGQGWSTVEILASENRVFIVPSETTVGTTDIISLRAVIWNSNSATWSCRTTSHEVCFTTKQELVSDVINMNSLTVTIPSGTLPVGSYLWTVENAGESNTAKVFVKPGIIPAITVDVSNVYVNRDAFVLPGTVRRALGDCRVWWSCTRETGFSYLHLNTDAEVSAEEIPLSIPSEMWEDPQPDSRYMFKLQVFCPQSAKNQKGSYDYIKVPVIVSNPPHVSPLSVEPLTGKAMITEFCVSGGEANFSNNPLTFEWSYIDPCDAEIPIERGAYSRNFKTYLPPGDVKLLVRVCDGRSICSTSTSPVISVVQASEFPAENFENARIQIEQLLTSGNTLEAFGLAITVFKSLVLVAETEVREKMFSTVEEGIKIKIKDFTRRMGSDTKARKLALEFYERASEVAKYFRKGSHVFVLLREFKKSVNLPKP